MVKNHFSRKCLCLLIILVIVSITGGDVQGATEEKEKDTKEKTYDLPPVFVPLFKLEIDQKQHPSKSVEDV